MFTINVLWGYFENNTWHHNTKLDITADEQYRQNAERLFTNIEISRKLNKEKYEK